MVEKICIMTIGMEELKVKKRYLEDSGIILVFQSYYLFIKLQPEVSDAKCPCEFQNKWKNMVNMKLMVKWCCYCFTMKEVLPYILTSLVHG